MTPTQGTAYELARELISSRIGNLSSEIAKESSEPTADQELISTLEARIVALAREREHLDPEDDASIGDVIQRYSRNPGLVMFLLARLSSTDEI